MTGAPVTRDALSAPGHRDIMHSLTAPVLLIHGTDDRVVPIEPAARVLGDNPHWASKLLVNVGHTPQLATPDTVLDTITGWVAYHPARTAR